jgi:hypothetical protein
MPVLTLSILIALPCETTGIDKTNPNRPIREEEGEDWADLPDLLIGTTQVCPMIMTQESAATSNAKPGGNDGVKNKDSNKAAELGALKKDGVIVQELEYQSVETRRARWEKMEGAKWRIEGLE